MLGLMLDHFRKRGVWRDQMPCVVCMVCLPKGTLLPGLCVVRQLSSQLCRRWYWLRYGMEPQRPVPSFTKEVHPRLAKRPLVSNGRLVNRGLTSLVKEATEN